MNGIKNPDRATAKQTSSYKNGKLESLPQECGFYEQNMDNE